MNNKDMLYQLRFREEELEDELIKLMKKEQTLEISEKSSEVSEQLDEIRESIKKIEDNNNDEKD